MHLGMLTLPTTQCCSTTREFITTALPKLQALELLPGQIWSCQQIFKK